MKDNQKHLTLSDRIFIEQCLNEGKTFTAIASRINKDPSIISKEIRKHKTIKLHKSQNRKPRCIHYKNCTEKHLRNQICYKNCNECL